MIEENKFGFIQGRFSPLVDGMIQAFPWTCWENEFQLATEYGWLMMEWTLDYDRLYENPIMTPSGREKIIHLCAKYHLSIPSLTGDFFMQQPFFKEERGSRYDEKLAKLIHVIESCGHIGVGTLVLPLVDNGSLEDCQQENRLIEGLQRIEKLLLHTGVHIAFESDFAPKKLEFFINKLNPSCFGINYDIGNSASLQYDPIEEFKAYGDRITNVHIKDRLEHGTTVPLGEGAAEFKKVLRLLEQVGYDGNYIFQTARAVDGCHASAMQRYKEFIINIDKDLCNLI